MKKVLVPVVLVIAVAAAFAVGRWTAPAAEAAPVAGDDDAYRPQKAAPVDPTNALKAQIAALKKRIASLESGKGAEPPRPEPAAEPLAEDAAGTPVATNARPERGPFVPLAELKKSDPEKYAEITNRMARFESRRLRRAQTRLDTLAQLNTDGFTKRQKDVHDQLQELLVRREELSAQMRANMENEDVTEADRRAAFDEMRSLHENIRQLEREERNTLLTTTARDFGLGGEDAAALVDTVKAIYDVTGQGEHGSGHEPPDGGRPPRER